MILCVYTHTRTQSEISVSLLAPAYAPSPLESNLSWIQPCILRLVAGNEGWEEGGWEEDRSDDDRRLHRSPKMAFFLHDAVGSLEKRTRPRDPSLYPSSAFVCLPLSPFMSRCLSSLSHLCPSLFFFISLHEPLEVHNIFLISPRQRQENSFNVWRGGVRLCVCMH